MAGLHRKRFAPATYEKAVWTFNDLVNPHIGSRPIASISAPELLAVLRRLEKRGKHETAHRTKQRCGQVFRYAIATVRATRDISLDLRGALAPVVSKNHAAIAEPRKIGALPRAIDSYVGHPTTQGALRLAPLVFLRPAAVALSSPRPRAWNGRCQRTRLRQHCDEWVTAAKR